MNSEKPKMPRQMELPGEWEMPEKLEELELAVKSALWSGSGTAKGSPKHAALEFGLKLRKVENEGTGAIAVVFSQKIPAFDFPVDGIRRVMEEKGLIENEHWHLKNMTQEEEATVEEKMEEGEKIQEAQRKTKKSRKKDETYRPPGKKNNPRKSWEPGDKDRKAAAGGDDIEI